MILFSTQKSKDYYLGQIFFKGHEGIKELNQRFS